MGVVIYTFGPPDAPSRFRLDDATSLTDGAEHVKIDATALKVLHILVQRPEHVFTNRVLADEVRGVGYSVVEGDFSKTYLKLVRKALGTETAVRNERNIGYCFGWKVNASDTAPRAPIIPAAFHDLTLPNLPQNHIPRSDLVAELRTLLLAATEGTNIAVTAVKGMGGIGKTVLTNELCRDAAIREAFPDGVAWITIGRESNIDSLTRMKNLVRALGCEIADEAHYRAIVREKSALLVIDDVWEYADVNQLLVDNAPHSRFIFTTRNVGIAKAVAAREFKANLLADEEARDLLKRWAGELRQPEADQIIAECGHLALAIAVIGPTLQHADQDGWRDTLDLLKNADSSALEESLPEGQASFFRSLEVSVGALTQLMQERYFALAVLIEDIAAALPVLQTLWGVSIGEARRTAKYLADRSLADWDGESLRLHDLLLDHARSKWPDRKALKLIHEATRLSAHVILRDPLQFASQVIGRLMLYLDTPAIRQFADQLTSGAPAPWLRTRTASLHPAGTPLIRTLEGHFDSVSGVAVTADGKRAVSASSVVTLIEWDLESGLELRTLEGHSDYVNGVALTVDGKRAVSASDDKTLKVWDLESGLELRKLKGHADSVSGVAVTVDGKLAVSASDDKTLKVWDLESGLELRTLEGHSSWVYSVAVAADGKLAVSAFNDATLKVWDLESGLELRTLKGHSDLVNGVAVTADGRRVVSTSNDNTLKLWDLESGRELRTLEGHSAYVNGAAVTADGKLAVSVSWDKTLKVWHLESGRELRALEGHANSVNGVAVTADGNRAVSASSDKTLKVWDLESCRALRTLKGHASSVNGVAVTADGKWAVSASDDNTLKVWDLESCHALRTLEGHASSVSGVAVTSDGKLAVSASGDTLKVWDLESVRELRTLQGHSDHVSGVAVTADGKRAVSASWDKTLKLWDLETYTLLATFTCDASAICCAWGKSDQIVAGDQSGRVHFLALET